MDASFDTWFSGLTFGSIIAVMLLFRLFKKPDLLARSLIIFFFICITLIGIVLIWDCIPNAGLFDDAFMYHQVSSQVSAAFAERGFWGDTPKIFIRNPAYTVPLGILYYVFGTSEMVGRLFSVIMSLGVIWNLHRLAGLLFNRRVANMTALVMAMYPYFWHVSIRLIRDTMVVFLITLFFLMLAEIQIKGRGTAKMSRYAIALFSLIYLGLLRPPLFVLLALSFFIYIVVFTKKAVRWQFLVNITKIIIIVAVMAVGTKQILSMEQSRSYPRNRLLEGIAYTDYRTLNRGSEYIKSASTYYRGGVIYSSYKDVILRMPKFTLYFLFSPFPWQVRSAKHAIGLFDSAAVIVVIYYFIKGFKDLYRRHRKFTVTLLLFLSIGCAMAGVMTSNSGGAVRHRTMFTYMMFPAAAHGFLRSRRKAGRFHMDTKYRTFHQSKTADDNPEKILFQHLNEV